MKPQMRRVVKLGRSTLAVTLPKEWVESVKLKKGDYVLAEDGGENTIRLSKMGEKLYAAPKVCVINVDSIKSKTFLTRLIIGAYTVGHELIWLHSRQGINPEQIMEVNKILQKLVGLHIVEQTENIVLLQSLADPSKPSLDNSIRRLHLLTNSMLENILQTLLTWDRSRLDDVHFTGGECDKIYWLITRQLITAAEDKRMAHSLGVKSNLWLVDNRAVVRILKTIIRHNESICSWALKIIESGIRPPKHIINNIVELGRFTLQIQSEAVEALLTRDIEKANNVIEQAAEKAQDVENCAINIAALLDDDMLKTAFLNIICELKCSILDLKAIAEIAINRGAEETGSYIIIETGFKREETTLRKNVGSR